MQPLQALQTRCMSDIVRLVTLGGTVGSTFIWILSLQFFTYKISRYWDPQIHWSMKLFKTLEPLGRFNFGQQTN